MPWSLIYAFWGNFKFNHAKSIHRFMEPALSPCRLLSGSMNSSMAPRACGDRPNLWMCGVPRGRGEPLGGVAANVLNMRPLPISAMNLRVTKSTVP